jgi:branched-subunit amino acid aminotransferase/4-amino-4-deoxychorismate lyase
LNKLKCYLNGAIIPEEKAQLGLNDLALLRGFGIFDYFVFERFQPRFLEDYLDRFYRSAKRLGLVSPIERADLKQGIHQLIAANEQPSGGVRLVLTGGYTPDGYEPTVGNLFILQSPFPGPPPIQFERGVRVATYQYQRELPEIKSLNYLIGIYLLPWLKEQDAEYILYHDGQYVRESDRSNFFFITQKGVLVTAGEKVLAGITRAKILALARKAGIPVEEREITLPELAEAKEAFLTSSTKGALPVSFIDGKAVGTSQPGVHTKALQAAFLALVADEQGN